MMTTTTFSELLCNLKAGPVFPQPSGTEAWPDLITRISVPGRMTEVDEDTYDYFLEVLPPRWMSGRMFAFGEGADILRLFWRAMPDQYFARQLTEEEHRLFCRLARICLTSG